MIKNFVTNNNSLYSTKIGGGITFKALSAAVLAGCAIIGCTPSVNANELNSTQNPSLTVLDDANINSLQERGQVLGHSGRDPKLSNAGNLTNQNEQTLNQVQGDNLRHSGLDPESINAGNYQNGQPMGFAADVLLGSDEANELLQNKPVDTPTLDYLKENNILIPQKGEYNSADNTWSVAEPITAPESAYTITAGTEEDHSFEYKTADKDGNITSSYYKIELRHPEQSEGSLSFGTSSHVTWEEVSAPAEGTDLPANTIQVNLSKDVTKYYQWTYTKPANYITVENQTLENTVTNPTDTSESNPYLFPSGAGLNNPEGTTTSINNVLYQNNTAKGILNSTTSKDKYAAIYGGAIYNKGKLTEVIGDFINNSATSSSSDSSSYSYAYGGALTNLGTIGDITGDFINNSATSSSSDSSSYSSSYSYAYGGAIANLGTIGDITGDFINNSITSNSLYSYHSLAYGGAIYNSDTIGHITGYL